jgi:dCMP deaminase
MKSDRISRAEWGLKLALVTAQRGTCLRRQVGCVLLSSKGHVLATGYNGVAAGQPHCNLVEPIELCGKCGADLNQATNVCLKCGFVHLTLETLEVRSTRPHACDGATADSGTRLDQCQAIHAEQNALLQCRDVSEIETACVTASPCITCVKLLMNTSCKNIVFVDVYPHDEARLLWLSDLHRTWVRLETSLP